MDSQARKVIQHPFRWSSRTSVMKLIRSCALAAAASFSSVYKSASAGMLPLTLETELCNASWCQATDLQQRRPPRRSPGTASPAAPPPTLQDWNLRTLNHKCYTPAAAASSSSVSRNSVAGCPAAACSSMKAACRAAGSWPKPATAAASRCRVAGVTAPATQAFTQPQCSCCDGSPTWAPRCVAAVDACSPSLQIIHAVWRLKIVAQLEVAVVRQFLHLAAEALQGFHLQLLEPQPSAAAAHWDRLRLPPVLLRPLHGATWRSRIHWQH